MGTVSRLCDLILAVKKYALIIKHQAVVPILPNVHYFCSNYC